METLFFVDAKNIEEINRVRDDIKESGAKIKKLILDEDVKIIKAKIKDADLFLKNFRRTPSRFQIIGYFMKPKDRSLKDKLSYSL